MFEDFFCFFGKRKFKDLSPLDIATSYLETKDPCLAAQALIDLYPMCDNAPYLIEPTLSLAEDLAQSVAQKMRFKKVLTQEMIYLSTISFKAFSSAYFSVKLTEPLSNRGEAFITKNAIPFSKQLSLFPNEAHLESAKKWLDHIIHLYDSTEQKDKKHRHIMWTLSSPPIDLFFIRKQEHPPKVPSKREAFLFSAMPNEKAERPVMASIKPTDTTIKASP